MGSGGRLQYAPLLAVGASVFLSVNILGDILGILRHVEVPWMFGGWVRLGPSLQEWTAQWAAWGACLLISISPAIVAFVRRRSRPEPMVMLTFLVFPSLSLLIACVSQHLGATLLVGSSFLIAYTITSRSQAMLDIEASSARRVVCAVVFSLLALTAGGGVLCVLLWQTGTFFTLTSGIGQILMEILLGTLGADLKAFYLAQPILATIYLTIALAAMVALLSEPARWLAGLLVKSVRKTRPTGVDLQASRHESQAHSSLAYLTLLGALVLGIASTAYPALLLHWTGADYPWYVGHLYSIVGLSDAIPFLGGDRGLFLLLLFSAKAVTGMSAEDVVRFAPSMLAVLLALSSFLLVREGTGRLWVSSFAAVLSVVSAQTTLGMYGGIIANWFALAVANFTFAMIIRSIRLRSLPPALGSLGLSLVLLAGYAYLWVVAVVELLLALVGVIAAFRAYDVNDWRHDVGILFGLTLGIVLIPFGLLVVVAPMLGLPEGLDPSNLLAVGWNYAQAVSGESIGSRLATLSSSLGLGGSHVELPFLALLSILGLLDHSPQTRSFTKIIAAMVLVALAIELVPNAPFYFPLRGLYLMPVYVLGALGAESIIRRVNGKELTWKTSGGLAFAGMFAAYIFLSQLGYTLRMFGLPLLHLL
jgi:hypothetical protein